MQDVLLRCSLFLHQGSFHFPPVSTYIKRCVENNRDLIHELVHFNPGLGLKSLPKSPPIPKPVYLPIITRQNLRQTLLRTYDPRISVHHTLSYIFPVRVSDPQDLLSIQGHNFGVTPVTNMKVNLAFIMMKKVYLNNFVETNFEIKILIILENFQSLQFPNSI